MVPVSILLAILTVYIYLRVDERADDKSVDWLETSLGIYPITSFR